MPLSLGVSFTIAGWSYNTCAESVSVSSEVNYESIFNTTSTGIAFKDYVSRIEDEFRNMCSPIICSIYQDHQLDWLEMFIVVNIIAMILCVAVVS